MRITQNGTELTVLMQSNRGELVEYEGSVNGDQVQWSGVRSTPRGTFTVTFTGTINGDAMSGAVDFGGWYSGSWNAQR